MPPVEKPFTPAPKISSGWPWSPASLEEMQNYWQTGQLPEPAPFPELPQWSAPPVYDYPGATPRPTTASPFGSPMSSWPQGERATGWENYGVPEYAQDGFTPVGNFAQGELPPEDVAGTEADPWASFMNPGGWSKGPAFNTPLMDYTTGFPEAPTMEPTDWTAINQQFEKSRPEAPTQDPALGWMAFLGAAAQASAGATSFGQALAAAGGGGLLGLLEQRQREQLMDQEYKRADAQWQAAKAQMMTAQTSADQQVARQNMETAYKGKLQLFELELQNRMQMQGKVTPMGGGSVMYQFYNPQTGQMESQVYQYQAPTSIYEQIALMKALKGDGSLDMGDYGSLDDSMVPPALKGAYNVSTLVAAGALPYSVFGDQGGALQEVINDARNAGLSEQDIIADVNAFLMSPQGAPLMQMALEYMKSN